MIKHDNYNKYKYIKIIINKRINKENNEFHK